MAKEVLELLLVPDSGERTMLDCTTGEGGHTELFLKRYSNLSVIGLDRDSDIQKKAVERLSGFKERFKAVNSWFDDYLKDAMSESFDVILFDLGISSYHFEESERGFSFRKDERLDMRLDKNQDLSAYEVVNTYSEEEISEVLFKYGEERYSRRIARAIRERREEKEIVGSKELSDLIFSAVPREYRYGRIHPATRSFQAIRIEVNGELERIESALEGALKALKRGGRVGVISFHSLEDRIAKHFFRERAQAGEVRLITKKPIIPSDEELEANPPSRSAKLRVVEKI